jgi:hypothetical protein
MVTQEEAGYNQVEEGDRRMKRLQRHAVVLSLIEKLVEKGSWCGETHIQKSTYFLQELLVVPLSFEFILYKHGPFSFDLRDELLAMRADDVIQLELRPPYGPSVQPGPRKKLMKRLFPKTLQKYEGRVEFVAKEVGCYGVADLESLATALYFAIQHSNVRSANIDRKASYIHHLKPHISLEQAHIALQREEQISNKARDLVGST